MKKSLLLVCIFCCHFCYSQDTLIVQANIYNDFLSVYKDSTGIFKIGEIPKQSSVFLLAPGGKFSFFAYGGGLAGYVNTSHIGFNKYLVRGLTYRNIDWKINEAKKIEISFQRNLDSIARQDSINIRAETIKALEKGKKDGLHVVKLLLSGNEYKVGFDISVINYVPKTIKYINFTVAGFNDVDDREALKTFKGVGPIKYLNFALYEYDDAFFSRTITKLKITKISVDYMDGTRKEYTGLALKNTLVYNAD